MNLKQGGFKVELDTTGLDKQIVNLRAIAMMLMLGLILTGVVIGSALAAAISGIDGSGLESIGSFASTVFVIAVALAGILIVVLAWRLFGMRHPKDRDPLDRI